MNDNNRIMKELKELTEAMKNVTSFCLIFAEIAEKRRGEDGWR
jgi:hypothetical protein